MIIDPKTVPKNTLGKPCLHCAFSMIAREWFEVDAIDLQDVLSGAGEVAAEVLAGCPDRALRRRLLAEIQSGIATGMKLKMAGKAPVCPHPEHGTVQ